MKTKTLTPAQREQIMRAAQLPETIYIRARNNGERVTLASLYYRNIFVRRVHSGAGTTSPAHEYQLHPTMREALRKRDKRGAVA